MGNKTAFDLEKIYDTEIAPLMTKIIEICRKHRLPMFATFLCANDPRDEDCICTTNLMFEERPIPDRLRQLAPSVLANTGHALRMRVEKSDGSVEETVVIP